jgi:large conductance mechanosensitive channel
LQTKEKNQRLTPPFSTLHFFGNVRRAAAIPRREDDTPFLYDHVEQDNVLRIARRAAMAMLEEFKKFAMKGNVVDLAVGVIIGGAFGKIVDSMVQDVIMPPIGKLFGGLDFASYYLPLNGQRYGLPLAEAKKAGAVLAYGNFFTILLNFLILAFVIFQMVRLMNRLRSTLHRQEETDKAAAPPPPPPEDILLLREIRDSLKK